MGVEGSEDTFSHPANCFSCPEILYSRNCESADAPTSVGQESQFKVPIFVRSHHATDFSLPVSLGAKSREVKLPLGGNLRAAAQRGCCRMFIRVIHEVYYYSRRL